MKKITFTFIPIMLAGFILPGENCGPEKPRTARLDGPYVLYKNELVFVKHILDDHGTKKVQADSMPVSQKATISLQVATDDASKMFPVQLKQDLKEEPAEFPVPNKMFILSDIEGNFAGFRKLLQAGGVIDANFNWSFGNGHLVLIGDFVDRGMQVTEVLWLIYSLEEKAKAAGGYVHYILGNHEIMNMSGDIRYVQPKYIESALLMNERYTSLYGDSAELGRWMRTKNVVEKIGDILFTHGGISRAVTRLGLSVADINKLARPFYADSTYQYNNPKTDTLYSDAGPFWYRGYYNGNKVSEMQSIDSTLGVYQLKRIATGHTVIADSIRVLYDGKVFDVDVHHAGGHSEAVLIEKGKYFRVKPSGEKILLLEE